MWYVPLSVIFKEMRMTLKYDPPKILNHDVTGKCPLIWQLAEKLLVAVKFTAAVGTGPTCVYLKIIADITGLHV